MSKLHATSLPGHVVEQQVLHFTSILLGRAHEVWPVRAFGGSACAAPNLLKGRK